MIGEYRCKVMKSRPARSERHYRRHPSDVVFFQLDESAFQQKSKMTLFELEFLVLKKISTVARVKLFYVACSKNGFLPWTMENDQRQLLAQFRSTSNSDISSGALLVVLQDICFPPFMNFRQFFFEILFVNFFSIMYFGSIRYFGSI